MSGPERGSKTSGGAAALATWVTKDALGASGALDDARSGAEPDHRARRPLLVPERRNPSVQAPALVSELGVRHLGQLVKQQRTAVGKAVDLVSDLCERAARARASIAA